MSNALNTPVERLAAWQDDRGGYPEGTPHRVIDDLWTFFNTYRQAGVTASRTKAAANDLLQRFDQDWLRSVCPDGTEWYGGCGVASIPIPSRFKERWELQVWPELNGARACDIRLIVPHCVPPSFQVDIGSVTTKFSLFQMFAYLGIKPKGMGG